MKPTIRSEKLRENLLTIADGHHDLVYNACCYLNDFRYAEEITDYMVKHKIIGANLKEMLYTKFNGSVFNLVSWVVAKRNNENPKGIYAGKDFIIKR